MSNDVVFLLGFMVGGVIGMLLMAFIIGGTRDE